MPLFRERAASAPTEFGRTAQKSNEVCLLPDLYYNLVGYNVLYYIILYHIMLCYIILYYVMLCYIVL